MRRSPETWRRLVRICGALGLILAVLGYTGLQQPEQVYRPPAMLGFYGGFALVLVAIISWYRYVPPRPPVPEEYEEIPESEEEKWE